VFCDSCLRSLVNKCAAHLNTAHKPRLMKRMRKPLETSKMSHRFSLEVWVFFASSLFSCAIAPLSIRTAHPPFRSYLSVLNEAGPKLPTQTKQMIVVEGIRLAVFDSGAPTKINELKSAPTIVCLHAIGHGGSDFFSFAKHFSSRYRIVILDWPGHGASENDSVPVSTQRYAQLLDGVLKQLELNDVILFGNSIGGGAAVRVAAAHPEKVKALILSNPAGFDSGGLLASLFIGHLKSRFQWGIEGQARFANWFSNYYDSILVTKAADSQRERIVRSGYESAQLLWEAWDSFSKPDAYLGPLLPSLRMPTFVAWADKDQLVQWSRNAPAIEKIAGVTVRHFEAGHTPFLETPEAFESEADLFLERLWPTK
jgi:pimeloyl-ACP methyl ester carboxylesterase